MSSRRARLLRGRHARTTRAKRTDSHRPFAPSGRYATLDGTTLVLMSAPKAEATMKKSSVQKFQVNCACRLVRFADVSPAATAATAAGYGASVDLAGSGEGRWQFSLEGEAITSVFAVASKEEREQWLLSILAALKHCHAVASARVEHSKHVVAKAAKALEAAQAKADRDAATEKASGAAAPMGPVRRGSVAQVELVDLKRRRQRAEAELHVLATRRTAQRINAGVHDDVVKSGAKQYEKLALRLANADSLW